MSTPNVHHSLADFVVPLGNISPLAGNPNDGDVDAVRASYQEFGQRKPIVCVQEAIDGDNGKPTGTVIAGNTQLAAAQELGWDGIAVVWTEDDEQTAKAYALADNRTGRLGHDDEERLAAFLEDLADTPLFAATGYTDDDLEDLLLGLGRVPELPALPAARPRRGDPDEAPPVPAEPLTQPGDVWILGPHRVMCGDCTKPEHVATLLDGAEPTLTLTDPPYCSGGFQETGKSQGSVGTTATHKQIANDRLSTRGYIALLKSALGNAPGAFAYVFTDWRMWVYLFDVVESSGFGVRSMIVWDKGTPGMGRGWRAQHELVMWAAKAVPPFDKHMSGFGNVVAAKRTGNLLHTTQKPVDLLAQLIRTVSDFAPSVYDPFAGSGSVLIAAEDEQRTFYGMELDALYCDVICRRFRDYTGTDVVHAVTGKVFGSE